MDFYEAVDLRRSVRKYRPEKIDKEIILKILRAANDAPSAMNRQPWEFIVVSGTKIADLGESYGKALGASYSSLPNGPSPDKVASLAESYGGAPHAVALVIEVSNDTRIQRADLESASAAMENLLLAATAEGLGTCWMTGPLREEKRLREILGVPESKELVAITPLGFPAESPAKKTRKDPDLSKKVTWID